MGTNYTRINDWGVIQIKQIPNASNPNKVINWKGAKKIPYSKYSIKESDMRVKTATFSSPSYIDLTTGLYAIRIVSRYHENFAGVVLDVDFNEDTGIYDYQCQDFSRFYISKLELIANKVPLYKLLMQLITHMKMKIKPKMSRKGYTATLSGLRPLTMYNQSLYKGNRYKGNPFNKNISIIARDKSQIEVIRDIVFSQLGYFDVYFNDRGVLQIEPLSKTDWENTGLHLTNNEFSDRKFKFSTTNTITGVIVNGNDAKAGKKFGGNSLVNLNLSAFFGNITTSIANPIQPKATTKKTTPAVTNKDNPYGKKAKKIWLGADSGSGGFGKEIQSLLEKNGWYVHWSGEGPNVHYEDYFDVSSDYQVLGIVDNGFCVGTVAEAYSSSIQNTLREKGVTVMFMFDTREWTNPDGMKPYRYGDFKGARIGKAWDDDFSGWTGKMNVDSFFRENHAVYCANPTASGIVDQFLKGGYYASKGIKV